MEPTCACGQRASYVVADWKGGWILLCRPHWEFWTDERIRIEETLSARHTEEVAGLQSELAEELAAA